MVKIKTTGILIKIFLTHQIGNVFTYYLTAFLSLGRVSMLLSLVGAEFQSLIASLTQVLKATLDFPMSMSLPDVIALVDVVSLFAD